MIHVDLSKELAIMNYLTKPCAENTRIVLIYLLDPNGRTV
jgi:hypothetical protein